LVANDNFSSNELWRNQRVHPYPLRVFQQYQECNCKPYGLGSLNVTNYDFFFIFCNFVKSSDKNHLNLTSPESYVVLSVNPLWNRELNTWPLFCKVYIWI
jgi:hypothetical protein